MWCLNRSQIGWARRARNRRGNSKYALSQNQYVHGMYRLEMKENWYKIEQNSTYSVRTGTYKYPTRKVCTFSLKYVLLSCFLYAVRTQYILFQKVRTRYVQGENSTYLVRTWGKKYVPVQSSTRWYSTIDEYNSVRTGTYQVRTTVHDSR